MKHGGDTEVVGTGHGKYMDFVVGGRGPWKEFEAGESSDSGGRRGGWGHVWHQFKGTYDSPIGIVAVKR